MANDIDILLNALGQVESQGTGGYSAKNPSSSASGKYQFMFSQWGDKIREFAKNPNLTEEEFRNNPQLQEDFAKHYANDVLTPEAEKLMARHGSKLKKRNILDINDARSLIHFQGYPNAVEYLKSGQTANSKQNLNVPSYIEKTRNIREKLKSKGDNMATKPINPNDEISVNVEDNEPTVQLETPETTSQLGAAARGIAQGVSFGFADEITAALESAITGKPYRKAVEESRKAYETAAKEYPKTTFGAELVGGAATMLIPGVGIVGRTAQATEAANAYRAAVAAGDVIAANAAKSVLTKELVRGGAQAGAIAGLGGAEDIRKPLETAKSVGTGALTGGALGYAIPKATQAIAETKAGQAVGEAVSKAGEFVKSKLTGAGRWQIPEFVNQPEKQARVNEIVQQGKASNLTDRQILNKIAVEFSDLPTKSLEQAYREPGITGTLKRAVAGSQEAAEFIERPEQLAYAEEAAKGKTAVMAKQAKEIETTKDILAQKADIKTQLNRESQDASQRLAQKRQELQQQWDTADATQKQNINEQLNAINESEKRLSTALEQRKNIINQYEQADEEIAQTVKIEMEKAAKTRSEQSMAKIGQIEQELNERVKQLGQDRQSLVDNLMDVTATDQELQAAYNIKRNLQQSFENEGLGREGRQALDSAFGGDSRFAKVKRYFDIKDAQREFDINQSNMEWNKKNGFWDEQKFKVKPGGKPAIPMKPEARPELTQEDIPAVGELVGALYAANSKVSSAAFGTPLATVKREVGKTVQEGMKDLNLDAYALQRHLNRTKSELETLRASPLFETRKIPVVGETGRVATVSKRLIKTEIPKNFAKSAKDYRGIMSTITRGESMEAADVARMATAAKEGLPTAPSPRIGQLQREVGDIQSRIANLASEREALLAEAKSTVPGIKLARGEEKRAAIGETIRGKLELRNRLRQIDDEMSNLNDQLVGQTRRKAEIGETEAQLERTLREAEGIPASARDVGQAAVIGAKGQVPFSIGKILLPSPKARIQFFNRIKTRFENPSLTAATRVAIERPITMEVIRSLAMTHKVSEPDLIKEFEDAGIPVEGM